MPRIVEDEEPLPQPPASTQVEMDHERRRSPRQGLIAKALIKNENGPGPGWKVDLLNISMLGLRFRSNTSLLPGDTASVKLEVGPVRWATKFKVIHAHQLEDGHYSIGCQFIANELSRASRRAA
jgi:PilZ domain-containing protein